MPATYNRFQLAAVVSPSIALRADPVSYAVWLLYTSGIFHGHDEAQARSAELLTSLAADELVSVAEWLTRVTECRPP